MATDRDLISIEKFNGRDFFAWHFQIRNLFKAKRLLRIVEGTELLEDCITPAQENDWQERDTIAQGIIMCSLERRFHKPLMIAKTAHQCWTRICELHESKNSGDVHELHTRFYALSLDGRSIPDFLADIEEIAQELLDNLSVTML